MQQDEYSIQELADLAGVSMRTIRYYTQEGLLPEPSSRGKFACYNLEHLDRLNLIRQLKESYLPLREIRQMLVSLSWTEVKELLSGKVKPSNDHEAQGEYTQMKPASSIRESALDYISRVLQNQPGTNKQSPSTIPSQTSVGWSGNLGTAVGPPPETWRRILLGPGVELHIKEPLLSQDREQIEKLIQYSQSLFIRVKK